MTEHTEGHRKGHTEGHTEEPTKRPYARRKTYTHKGERHGREHTNEKDMQAAANALVEIYQLPAVLRDYAGGSLRTDLSWLSRDRFITVVGI